MSNSWQYHARAIEIEDFSVLYLAFIFDENDRNEAAQRDK